MTEEVKKVNMDDSLGTTKLYDQIYQLLVEQQTITDFYGTEHTIDVLKSDFDNSKLRNIILMLLLANSAKLDPNVAFKPQSENGFVLQEQLRENNGGIALSDEQNISFKKQEGEVHYVNLLSDLKIQQNDLTFVFNRDTKSFNKIIEIARRCALELPKQLEYSTKTDEEKKEFINTQIQLTKDLCQKYDESLKEFKKNANITNLKSSIYEVINELDTVIEIFNFIQNTTQKEELKKSVSELVGKFNASAQLLYSKLKEKIDQKKQLEKEIHEQLLKEDEEGLTKREREELLKQQRELFNLNQIPHIQVLDKIQRFSKQWNEVQEQTTQEFAQFEILFNTKDTIRQCQDIVNINLSFTPDNNSYSDFILQVMLPIICQLAFTGIEKTNSELITKIIGGQYNDIIQQRIAQLLNDALQNNQPLPELNLNNLLDEDLIKVYDIATLFTNSQGRSVQLTEDQESLLSSFVELTKNSETLIKDQELLFNSFIALKEDPEKLTEEQVSLLNKVVSKKDEKNEDEDLFGENPTMIALEPQQLKQVSGIMEIMEIARTTENPEVLEAIWEQKCFKLNINILLEISKNLNANSNTLFYCVDALENIAQNSENLEIQKQCIEGIKEILKPNADSYILSSYCLDALEVIIKYSENLEIQKQYVEGIKEISRNLKTDPDTFFNCIINLVYIGENFKCLEIQAQCIEGIKEISRNSNANSDTLFYCLDSLRDIAQNSKNSGIQKQCIEGIREILKNPKADLSHIFHCYVNIFRDISKNSKDPEIQKQCIEGIKEISKNLNADSDTLSYCVSALGYIGENSKDPKIQKQCVEVIKKISKKLNADSNTLSNCAKALSKIVCSDRVGDNIKLQCIDRIIEIMFENIDIVMHHNSHVYDLRDIIVSNILEYNMKQQCIDKIIKISETADENTLYKCVRVLANIVGFSNNSEIHQQCMGAIMKIMSDNINNKGIVFECIIFLVRIASFNNSEIQQQCINVIMEISNTADKDTLQTCICMLKYTFYNNSNSEIQQQCINGIIEIISKNSNNKDIVSCGVSALREIACSDKVGDNIKQQCSKVIDKITNKKDEDNYIQSSISSPTSSAPNNINIKPREENRTIQSELGRGKNKKQKTTGDTQRIG